MLTSKEYPKVAIITPSFNQGKYIERTINSVLSQQYPSLEYIVRDGGSQDETVAILQRFDASLKWVSKKDGGQTNAVNEGIKNTEGEIIGWLNSDDIYYSGAIKKVVAYFNDHPEIDVIYGEAYHIDAQDNIIERYPTQTWDLNRLKIECYICQPSLFFRRRVIEQYGLLNEKLHYCMDYEYWLRLGLQGAKFAFLNEILAGSRLHEDTKTLSARTKVHKEINEMLQEKIGIIPDRWVTNYAYMKMEDKFSRHTWYFPLLVSFAIYYASIIWNKRITGKILLMSPLCKWPLDKIISLYKRMSFSFKKYILRTTK